MTLLAELAGRRVMSRLPRLDSLEDRLKLSALEETQKCDRTSFGVCRRVLNGSMTIRREVPLCDNP